MDCLPSVDVQATEGLIENTTVYVRSKAYVSPRGHVPKYLVTRAG